LPNASIVSSLSIQGNTAGRVRAAGRLGSDGIPPCASRAKCTKPRYNGFMPGTLTPAFPALAVDTGAAFERGHGEGRRPGSATPVSYPVSRMWPGITEGIWDARCSCTRAPLSGVYQVKRLNGACPVHLHQILPAGMAGEADPGGAGSGRRAKKGTPRASRIKAGPRRTGGVSAASSRPKRAHPAPGGNAAEIEYCRACDYPLTAPGHKFICG
jgi:hypothetical protein